MARGKGHSNNLDDYLIGKKHPLDLNPNVSNMFGNDNKEKKKVEIFLFVNGGGCFAAP